MTLIVLGSMQLKLLILVLIVFTTIVFRAATTLYIASTNLNVNFPVALAKAPAMLRNFYFHCKAFHLYKLLINHHVCITDLQSLLTDDQIWKNFLFNEEMTSKMQPSCRLMHR